MKLKLLFVLAAVYWALMSLLLQAVPEMAFGLGPNASPTLIANLRVPASLTIPLAVLNWFARGSEPSGARDAILLADFVAFTVVGVGDLVVTLIPGGDPTGWVFVVINLSFAIAFFACWRSNLSAKAV